MSIDFFFFCFTQSQSFSRVSLPNTHRFVRIEQCTNEWESERKKMIESKRWREKETESLCVCLSPSLWFRMSYRLSNVCDTQCTHRLTAQEDVSSAEQIFNRTSSTYLVLLHFSLPTNSLCRFDAFAWTNVVDFLSFSHWFADRIIINRLIFFRYSCLVAELKNFIRLSTKFDLIDLVTVLSQCVYRSNFHDESRCVYDFH